MREPNFSVPSQHKAAVVISSTLYDRRALDCTATLPLVNSLTHLAYMTSTSPRIREILATDGGLERLVKILATCQHTDRRSLWKWSLAFQCVVNVGVRGTETIRTRVVNAGTIHIVLAILENFMDALEKVKLEKDERKPDTTVTALSLPTMPLHPSRSTPITPRRLFNLPDSSILSSTTTTIVPFSTPTRRTFIIRTPKTKPKTKPSSTSAFIPLLSNLTPDAVIHREDDIILSLQLLAYLSKYPQLRQALHTNHHRNVFSVVEKFTHRFHPTSIIYWAGVIMRNACRKDETQGGRRQCAHMQCGKWEQYPREFAKCRRCRKAKYCSKSCQSKAWAEGHRWWCVERTQSANSPATNAPLNTTAAVVAAAVAAAPQLPTVTDQVVPLDQTTGTEVVPITIDHQTIQVDTEPVEEDTHRSSLSMNSPDHTPDQPRRDPRLFYHHRRRNSRSTRSLASGSSTEVEAEPDTTQPRHDLMDVD
ncbi:hypothetical protein J3Q64DRAFT_1644424 [Phycomyces blakesleeanus]|uniref:MYND-type domain-containing protein n=2 Tax=Phycomyces blakesleeanus TaxID=4837 RepID=A0A167KE10_PHYB8|nr:hypothetical protein PHYBLDRAFT_79090 [Phycomyces blakesleeanus NRRL 1555(-)]OAD67875.1 hypothetical protein PHYBLDRAFT_79090 [Phycomyces blakesleeanus NRRL 1555(-)]|eukprot:XP_018285915.1 hypothetical protein PHYBLDRAFT_79090 [Phycomyces blakesleeanus NRRL 1555(-)]